MSENQAIIPGIPLAAENKSAGATQPDAKAGLYDSIKSAATGAFEKVATVIKRGRGRPRKDGSPKASDVVEENPGEFVPENRGDFPDEPATRPLAAAPGGLSGLSSSVLQRCIRGGVKGLFSIPCSMLAGRAEKRGMDATAVLNRVMPTEDELKDMAELGEFCLRKHQVTLKYAEETALGVTFLGVLGRLGIAWRETAPQKEQPV